MDYCTIADIQAIAPAQDLIDLTDDAGTGQMQTSVVQAYIDDAGEIIDSYIRGRYVLPLSPVPLLLKKIARDIALHDLYSRRIRINPPEAITAAHKQALAWLQMIQAGKLILGTDDSQVQDAPSIGMIQTKSPDRVFSDSTLKDYLGASYDRNPMTNPAAGADGSLEDEQTD